jgi:hypothetical protein
LYSCFFLNPIEKRLYRQKLSSFVEQNKANFLAKSGKKKRQRNFIITDFFGEICLNPEEHSEYRWASLEEIEMIGPSDQTKRVILDAFQKRNA